MWRIAILPLAVIFVSPAVAQQQNPNSNSQSYSGSQVTVQGDTVYGGGKQRIRQDITASGIAPGLTAAGVHSCAGSASIGMGVTGFNFGAGATYEMQECNRRAYAATLMGMGMKGAALALVCNNPEVQQSLNLTGVTCPQQQAAMQAAAAQQAAQQQQVYYQDGAGNQPGTRYIPANGRGGAQLIPISANTPAAYASTGSVAVNDTGRYPPFCYNKRSYNASLCAGMAPPR
jgi:hypothetical protein